MGVNEGDLHHPIYSGRQACGRTSQGVTQDFSTFSFCGACLNFSRVPY